MTKRKCATLIQKTTRLDSIVAHFYSTGFLRRLLQQYLPETSARSTALTRRTTAPPSVSIRLLPATHVSALNKPSNTIAADAGLIVCAGLGLVGRSTF